MLILTMSLLTSDCLFLLSLRWAITIGLLLAAIVNESTKDRDNASSWHIPIAVQFAWAGILAIGVSVASCLGICLFLAANRS